MTDPRKVVLPRDEASAALTRTTVSHLAFSVPEVDETARFYERVLGLAVHEELPDGGLRLGWGSGHHVLDLAQGEKGLRHYAFEVRDPGGVDRIARRLAAAGHAVGELDEPRGIRTTDPDGTEVHFHGSVSRLGEHTADTGRRPIRYQHITLGTDNVENMVSFYVDLVGFQISDQLADGRFAWLRSDRDHHTLAAVDVGRKGGLDHYSYDLAQWQDFKTWCDWLTDEGVDVTWGPGRHGPGNNLFVFFDDPAGNHVELSAEMERFHHDRANYETRQWRPIPNTINLWGGQLASWRRTSGGR